MNMKCAVSMEASEALQFDKEVYSQLQMAEQEAELTDQRYSPDEVWKAMQEAIRKDAAASDF